MNILHGLAQGQYYYNEYGSQYSNSGDPALLLVVFAAFIGFGVLFGLAIYVFISICLMRIFAKAGVKPWVAWVPFYNSWKLLEIGGQQGFWAVLTIVPIVNIVAGVFILIAQYHVGKKLGKGGEFVLWAIFLPYVWYPWLAFDKSTWNDAASTAPSLHKA
jgi:hypothetical protein